MSQFSDWALAKDEDGTLTIQMTPPTAVGGWDARFDIAKRFGGTPIVTKYVASGFNGVSGITITNSGQGIFSVRIDAADSSGLDEGVYASWLKRTSSGFSTVLFEGYRLLTY